MEIIGRGYIIQHCVASLTNKSKERAYRIYVTDALKVIADNTAHIRGGGTTITARFADIITPKKPEEERTEEDIINGLKDKLRKIK